METNNEKLDKAEEVKWKNIKKNKDTGDSSPLGTKDDRPKILTPKKTPDIFSMVDIEIVKEVKNDKHDSSMSVNKSKSNDESKAVVSSTKTEGNPPEGEKAGKKKKRKRVRTRGGRRGKLAQARFKLLKEQENLLKDGNASMSIDPETSQNQVIPSVKPGKLKTSTNQGTSNQGTSNQGSSNQGTSNKGSSLKSSIPGNSVQKQNFQKNPPSIKKNQGNLPKKGTSSSSTSSAREIVPLMQVTPLWNKKEDTIRNQPVQTRKRDSRWDVPKNESILQRDRNLPRSANYFSQDVNYLPEDTSYFSRNTDHSSPKKGHSSQNMNYSSQDMNYSSQNMNYSSQNMDYSSQNTNYSSQNTNYLSQSTNHLSQNQLNLQSLPRDYESLSRNEVNTSRYQGNLENSWNLPRHHTSFSRIEADSSNYQDNADNLPMNQISRYPRYAENKPSTSRIQEEPINSSNFRDRSPRRRERSSDSNHSHDVRSHNMRPDIRPDIRFDIRPDDIRPDDIKSKRYEEYPISPIREIDLTRVIVSENSGSPDLTIEELMLVRTVISHQIDRIEDGRHPRFDDTYLKFGGIVVESADEWSRDWLIDKIPKLQPWTGARLKVVDSASLEVFHRANLWIPSMIENAEIVLRRLENQNPGLKTGNWRVYCGEETNDPRGYNLIVGIPNKCMRTLEALDLKPYLGMSRVTITLILSEKQ